MKNNTPIVFDLFTAGKTPEFAIFFNLACDNLVKYARSIDPSIIEKNFFTKADSFSDKVYTYLREYLWKGNTQNKNDEGHNATEAEKSLIAEMVRKVHSLRNFHSHIWHDNNVLEFSDQLQKFICHLHDSALAKVSADVSKNNIIYLDQRKKVPFFKEHESRYFITQEGRLYFLSFFLNKGEMQLLLNQSKGSKQNNLPEYKFKHEIFTYYCHREGSSWDSSGIMNELLKEKNDEEKQRILKGRQAFRIINYLNNTPILSKQGELLPILFEHEGRVIAVETSESLLQFIRQKQLLLELEFNIPETPVVEDTEITDEKQRNEFKKREELKKREGWLEMKYKGLPWTFEISFSTLRHVVTDILTGKNIAHKQENGSLLYQPAEKHFLEVLKDCVKTRQHFYEGLKQAGEKSLSKENFKLRKYFSSVYIDYARYSDSTSNVYYEPDQLRHIPILSTPKIEKKLMEWHQSFTLGKDSEITRRKHLLNLIRPADVKFDTSIYRGTLKNGRKKVIPSNQEPEPLLFHLAYYYKEQSQNARQADMFIEWAARYFMDYKLVPDWYWEAEKYIYESKPEKESDERKLKKELFYTKEIPGGSRVRVIDNGVTIGLPKNDHPTKSTDFYKFRLEAKALRYLLLLELQGHGDYKRANDFLLAIKADVYKLHQDEENDLQLLEDFAIPGFLKKVKSAGKPGTLRQELEKFIKRKIKWIDESLALSPKLNRNARNRIILEAYQLFDFSKTNGGKFLRKSEYEQMSICHFMLNQNRSKVRTLLHNVFALQRRLPSEILELLESANDLNGLFESVLEKRKTFLQNLLKNIKGEIPPKHLRAHARQFNIKLPTPLLTPVDAVKRKEMREISREHIPFIIHPIMVLKYFYPDEYKTGGFSPNTDPGTRHHRNILKEFRDSNANHLLINEYYDAQKLDLLLPVALLEKMEPKISKEFIAAKKKLTGNIIDTHTKDLLLWRIAEKYLMDYDKHLYENIRKQQSLQTLKLSSLFNERVKVGLEKSNVNLDKYTAEEKNNMPDVIYMYLQMHQVDDYFYRSQKDRLYQLTLHFIQRRREELELYKGLSHIKEKIEQWPDGTEQNPVLMSDLINERKICAGLAKELMGYILQFERLTLYDYCRSKMGVSAPDVENDLIKKERQQILEEFAKANLKTLNNRKYIPFKMLPQLMVDSLPTSLFNDIKSLRNKCQHSVIPLNGSFRKMSMPSTDVGKTLGIEQRLGRDRAAENPYEQDKENGMP